MDIIKALIENGELISRNAEADLYLCRFLGVDAVLKIRVEKPYRDPRLDRRLRRLRTYREVSILTHLHSRGVLVPRPLYASLKDYAIILEYIEGNPLSRVLPRGDEVVSINSLEALGSMLASIHNEGIVHGDPNLTNMILAGDKLYIIDFGLSYWSESPKDHALDVDVVRRSLETTVPHESRRLLDVFLESYKSVYREFDELYRFYQKLVRMGRYHEYRG